MLIYKIADEAAWRDALAAGQFAGSADDLRDGFVHLSASAQVRGTLAKHFSGRRDLVIAAVDAEKLGGTLKWEVSRGGDTFPHLYEPLPIAAVVWWRPLPLGGDGAYVLPREFE